MKLIPESYLPLVGPVNQTINLAMGEIRHRVWAVSGPDTLRSDITSGAFQISDAKPGVYRLIVEANPPYKSQAKDSVVVADGEVTDVGVIMLQQSLL